MSLEWIPQNHTFILFVVTLRNFLKFQKFLEKKVILEVLRIFKEKRKTLKNKLSIIYLFLKKRK